MSLLTQTDSPTTLQAVRENRLIWSRARLAREAGVSEPTIRRLEQGLPVRSSSHQLVLQALNRELRNRIPDGEREREGGRGERGEPREPG